MSNLQDCQGIVNQLKEPHLTVLVVGSLGQKDLVPTANVKTKSTCTSDHWVHNPDKGRKICLYTKGKAALSCQALITDVHMKH